jgi:BMFP domain-containing protein YqiC
MSGSTGVTDAIAEPDFRRLGQDDERRRRHNGGMGREAESSMREKMREWVGGMDLVSRDEFEAVKAMAIAAREKMTRWQSGSTRSRRRQARRRQVRAESQAVERSQVLTDETEHDERDDGAPIEMLEQYFEARGWACERAGEGEIIASATGSWAQYELRGVWRPEDQVLQFLAFPDIKVAVKSAPRFMKRSA